jgi:hypothetical protein
MNAKFFLMLLALNGLFLDMGSASASATTLTGADRQITNLSNTISELIGIDRGTHTLVELAIDRALLAQKLNSGTNNLRTAGAPVSIQDDQKPELAVGKMAVPNQSIGQTKIKKTKQPKSPLPVSNHQQPAGSRTIINQK